MQVNVKSLMIAVSLSLTAYFVLIVPNTQEKHKATAINTVIPVVINPQNRASEAVSSNTLSTSVPLANKSVKATFIRSYEDISSKEDSFSDVLSEPAKWMGRAKSGDALAGRKIFAAISNCFSADTKSDTNNNTVNQHSVEPVVNTAMPGCNDLPKSTGLDKLDWLDLGASRGDGTSAYLYAINAKSLLILDPELRTSPQYSKEAIELKSRQYLETAASTGIREAFLATYESLLYGSYGIIDPIRAHAFIFCLMRLDETFDAPTSIKDNLNRLSSSEQMLAKDLSTRLSTICRI
jgi:hypothetical protein